MSVFWRLARVGTLKVNNLFHASVVQLGDNQVTVLNSRAIALQRAIPDFYGDETRFSAYSIFFRPLPIWEPAREDMLETSGPFADIRVGSIKVISINASSLIRIGSGDELVAESRIKHIRQFNNVAPGTFVES